MVKVNKFTPVYLCPSLIML